MTFSSWQAAALFACVAAIAVGSFWLGYRLGSASKRTEPAVSPASEQDPEPSPAPASSPEPHIPAYRVNELTVLMELGILTPEEFELEKDKLLAGRVA